MFAFSWTYERSKNRQDFINRDNKFWELLQEFCPRRRVTQFPLVSNFCQGWGEKYYSDGEVLLNHSWTCLSLQQIQPTENDSNAKICSTDAYKGGGCLLIRRKAARVRLFALDALIDDDLFVSYVYKSISISLQFSLVLTVVSGDREITREYHLNNDVSIKYETVVNADTVVVCQPIKEEKSNNASNNNDCKWQTRQFFLSGLKGQRMTEISILFQVSQQNDSMMDTEFLLGELRLITPKIKTICNEIRKVITTSMVSANVILKDYPTQDIVLLSKEHSNSDGSGTTVVDLLEQCPTSIKDATSCYETVTWDLMDDILSHVSHFHVYRESNAGNVWQYVGNSPICSFSFCLTNREIDCTTKKFKIVPILLIGDILPPLCLDSSVS